MQATGLIFDHWLASSEGGTWDYAAFIANGNVEATTGGTDNDRANFIYTVPADGEYIFEWTYQKDGSRDQGDDCVYVDEVCILPAVGVSGDVGGDGHRYNIRCSHDNAQCHAAASSSLPHRPQLRTWTATDLSPLKMHSPHSARPLPCVNECFLSHYTEQQSSENSVKLYTREKMPKI